MLARQLNLQISSDDQTQQPQTIKTDSKQDFIAVNRFESEFRISHFTICVRESMSITKNVSIIRWHFVATLLALLLQLYDNEAE